jgi:hypothetical protein
VPLHSGFSIHLAPLPEYNTSSVPFPDLKTRNRSFLSVWFHVYSISGMLGDVW